MAKIRDVMILTLPAEWQGRGLVFGSASGGDGPPPPGPPEASFRDWDIFEMRMMTQILLARLGGPVAWAIWSRGACGSSTNWREGCRRP